MDRGYVISKNNSNKEIQVIEFETSNGFDVNPKNKVKKKNTINVTKAIFMSPTMIEKILNKKIDKQYASILDKVSRIVSGDDDDDDDTSFMVGVLNEVELFKSIIKKKYSNFMKEEQTEKLLRRLSIMSKELKKRIFEIEEEKIQNRSIGGKGR